MATLSGNRFAPATPDNQSGSVWIATLLCLIYSALVLVVRGHLRWNMYSTDDWLAAAAVVAQLGEVSALVVALKHGTGQSSPLFSEAERSTASQATFAGQILFIVAACLAKCSTLVLMMRLFNLTGPRASIDTKSRALWWSCSALFALMVLFGIGSIVTLSVDCSPLAFAQTPATAHCPDLLLRWRVIAALDVATEALLVFISVLTVWPVQLSFRLKLQVVAAFALRLPVAAIAILHLHFIANYVHSETPALSIVPVLVCQQVELCWSLISTTIPNLKSFVKSFSCGFGLNIHLDASSRYGSRSYGGAAYELGSVKKTPVPSLRSGRHIATIPDHIDGRSVAIPHGRETSHARKARSSTSMGSEDHIIRKDIRWLMEDDES